MDDNESDMLLQGAHPFARWLHRPPVCLSPEPPLSCTSEDTHGNATGTAIGSNNNSNAGIPKSPPNADIEPISQSSTMLEDSGGLRDIDYDSDSDCDCDSFCVCTFKYGCNRKPVIAPKSKPTNLELKVNSGSEIECDCDSSDCECNNDFENNDFDDYNLDDDNENFDILAADPFRRDIPEDEDLIFETARKIIDVIQVAMDDEANGFPGVSGSYDWKEDFDLVRGESEVFSGPQPGPIKDYKSPYDAFVDIWDDGIINLIVRETNRYAGQTIDAMQAAGTWEAASHLHDWTDTDTNEIKLYFAVLMSLGMTRFPCESDNWMTSILEMTEFKKNMTRERYIMISKFLHFSDNFDTRRNPQQQREGVTLSFQLTKLAPVISHLNEKFSSLYNLSRDIAIDESLALWMGHVSWASSVMRKPLHLGTKSYELYESQTGYLHRFEITKREKSNDDSFTDAAACADLASKSTQAVLNLLKGLEGRGHRVTMDNFYNCPAWARYLKSLGFDCLGKLNRKRRYVPEEIANIPEDVAEGTIIARQCGDVSIVAWKHCQLMTMISTYHTAETYMSSQKDKLVKPKFLKDYNNAMRGIDLKDQRLSKYTFELFREPKWYMMIFKRLLNISIHNAFIMYERSFRRRGKLPLTHRGFRHDLAMTLAKRHRTYHLPTPDPTARLRTGVLHCPQAVYGSENRRPCVYCLQLERNELVYTYCELCSEFLCIGDCWVKWHTLAELPGQGQGRIDAD